MHNTRRSPCWIRVVGLIVFVGAGGLSEAQVLTKPAPARPVEPRRNVPAKVEAVLRSIDETGKAPSGVMGGREYENHARRGEQPLPRIDREGDAIRYQTWDVNPRGSERDRGRERLVVGTDGSAYYTSDDYRTFETVRNPSRSVHVASRPPETGTRAAPNRNAPAEKPVVALDPRTAAKVRPVVDHILANQAPPPETVGGREYRNLGTEDGEVLPRSDANHRPIRYREWDVNRKVAGRNRGAERLITGSDGRVYYTNDHYATFQRIK